LAGLHTEVHMARSEIQALTSTVASLEATEVLQADRLHNAEQAAAQFEQDSTAAREGERQARALLASYSLKLTPNQIAIFSVLVTIISTLIGALVSVWLSRP
jgi:hypothetical protein